MKKKTLIILSALIGLVVIISATTFIPKGILTGKITANVIQDSGIQEGAYIELIINETLNPTSGEIAFELIDLKMVSGLYGGLVEEYYPESGADYILRTYNSAGGILDEYNLYTSRILLWDSFGDEENPGGRIESDQGELGAVIDCSEEINSIKISNGNKETDLGVSPSQISCQITCKQENETMDFENERCCSGLLASEQNDGSYICSNCGDGICSEYEDVYSCIEDCAYDFTCPEDTFKFEYDCKTTEQRIKDWLDERITTKTLMEDIKDYIL